MSGRFNVQEDGGIGALRRGTGPLTLPATEPSSARLSAPSGILDDGARQAIITAHLANALVRNAALDAMRASFAPSDRQWYLDPFAPADARDTEVIAVLRATIAEHRSTGGVLATVPQDADMLLALFDATIGWGPAQKYLRDPRVQEIKINGTHIQVQEQGFDWIPAPETFSAVEDVQGRVKVLASVTGIVIDINQQQQSIPLGFGSRMHVSFAPLVENGVLVCIRRGRTESWTLDDVLRRQSMSQEVYDLLVLLIRANCSFLIAGQPGSGKTALLEAMANTWAKLKPGTHILTIEDQTAEISIAEKPFWTRQVIKSSIDPHAYGTVAKNALRQTPGLMTPGETRAEEAGAILSIVKADIPVITTLHATSCEDAVHRFASCAEMPASYMYAGRPLQALRDTCTGFDVVIRVTRIGGTRIIEEVALLGSDDSLRDVVPRLITVTRVDVTEDGRMQWRMIARPSSAMLLEWVDGEHAETPPRILDKLRRARIAAARVRSGTTLDAVLDALPRATLFLQQREPGRALAVLRAAWAQRRDARLVNLATTVLAQSPSIVLAEREQAARGMQQLTTAQHRRRWHDAQRILDDLMRNVVVLGACEFGEGGYAARVQQIGEGIAYDERALAASADAIAIAQRGQARQALDMLRGFTAGSLALTTELQIVMARETALDVMVTNGEGSVDTLQQLRARRTALTHAIAQEDV